MRIERLEVDPLRAPVPGAVRHRPRQPGAARDAAGPPAHRRAASTASARPCRSRCAAALPGRDRRRAARALRAAARGRPTVDAQNRSRRADRGGRAGCRSPPQALAAIDIALLDLAGKVAGEPALAPARSAEAAPGPLQRDADRRRARATSPSAAERWAEHGLRHLQAQGRAPAATWRRSRRCARRSGPRRAHPRRRQRRVVAPTRRSTASARWSAQDLELAEQPAPDLAGAGRACAEQSAIPIAADESVTDAERRAPGRRAGGLRPARR